jgi:peptidoglycan/LPS O-acetylase OafA/YrhL
MSARHNPALSYRPEIDGLRALAVLPVMLFHAGFALFSGGFVGVDVFFVISGYLITAIILSELQAGRFSLVNFYERRARRILPALCVMMLVCVPLAWHWLDPQDLKSFAKSLIAVPLFSSNVLFWRETGYFDTGVDLKPLLHTWTLAVEEQYYVFFPLLLMAGWRLGRRWIVALLAVLAVASLALAQHGAEADSSAAFYLLHARAWELLVGSFIAFYFNARRAVEVPASAPFLRQLAALAGIGLIAYGVFGFDHSTVFPGLNALVPTLGAALVILFAQRNTWVGQLLATRPLVAVGLISYSAYLWHQPVFAFARNASLVAPAPVVMLGLTGLSLVLAWLSWRFVERAFRDRKQVSRAQIFRFGALASVLFIGLGLTGFINNGFANRFHVDPAVMTAFDDPDIRASCDVNYDGNGWGIDFCFFGTSKAQATAQVAVFGDSHSEALLPAFDSAGKRLGVSIAHLGVGGCPPLLGVDVVVGNYGPGACANLAQRQYDYVKRNGIKKVILVSRWTLYTDGDYDHERLTGYFLVNHDSQARSKEASRAVFAKALETTIDAYRALGTEVMVVAQVPQQLANPKNLYYRLARDGSESEAQKLATVDALSVSLEKHQQLQQFTRGLFEVDAQQGRIQLVTLDDALCRGQSCLIGDQDSWYKDYNHLSAKGVAMVSADIGRMLGSK